MYKCLNEVYNDSWKGLAEITHESGLFHSVNGIIFGIETLLE